MINKNIKILEKYCKDYTKIENYEEALSSPLKYDLHHRREISESKSKKQLIEENLYYGRPPDGLIFLEHGEHQRLHKEGENNPMFGKNLSAETREKISDALKGNQNTLGHHFSEETKQKISDALKGNQNTLGHHFSQDTRQRMSEAHKGRHWHLEDGHRIWTD